MSDEWLQRLTKHLVGRQCEVQRREADWVVNLIGGGSIALPIPWRIVLAGRIVFANEDDGQKFGLPEPVDGEEKSNALIGSRCISAVSVDAETADLTIYFGNDVRLDDFTNSSGYEGWHINLPVEHGAMSVVALGGGEIAIF